MQKASNILFLCVLKYSSLIEQALRLSLAFRTLSKMSLADHLAWFKKSCLIWAGIEKFK